MKQKLIKLAGVVAILFSFSSANATVLTIGGGWDYESEVMTAPEYFTETWTFDGAATLFVTDWAVATDLFDVWLDGAFLGSTSYSPDGLAPNESDADVAFALDAFSSGEWKIFGGGSHEVMIYTTHIPGSYSDSTVALKIESVPEPSILALLGLGLAGIGFARKKKA